MTSLNMVGKATEIWFTSAAWNREHRGAGCKIAKMSTVKELIRLSVTCLSGATFFFFLQISQLSTCLHLHPS